MKIFKFNGAGNVIKNVSANVSGNLKKAIEPVPKLGAGKIASIWDAERSLKTQPNWVFGEALRRSYAPKDAARLSRMSFGTGSL